MTDNESPPLTATPPPVPPPGQQGVIINGRECHFTDYGGIFRITDAPFGQAAHWLWGDGEWHPNLDGASKCHPSQWKTEDEAREFAMKHAAIAAKNCNGCGKELLRENAWMTDGCPCNTPKGVNDGNQIISEWRNKGWQAARNEIESLKKWRPMTNEEAEKAFGEAEPIPFEDGEIESMVHAVTSPEDEVRLTLMTVQSQLRASERERDRWAALYDTACSLDEQQSAEVAALQSRLSAAEQSAAAMRATITEVIADIDSHYSEVELATGETLIGSWREKLADLLPTPTPPRSRT